MDTADAQPTQKLKYVGREKEYQREWYERNKERIDSTYPQRREAILARLRATPISEANRLRKKAYLKQWHKNNRDKVLASRRKRAASGKHKAYHDKWRKENAGKWYAAQHKRRALEKAATINLKSIEKWMQSVKSKKVSTCYYCQKPLPSEKIHFDHIVALSRGGSHSVENLCVSCRDCNCSKHAKSIQAFVVTGQQILSL
jgi:Restriction endonuclease